MYSFNKNTEKKGLINLEPTIYFIKLNTNLSNVSKYSNYANQSSFIDEENNNRSYDGDELMRRSYNYKAKKLEYYREIKYQIIQFIQIPPPLDTLVRCKLKINLGIFNTYTMYLEKEDIKSEVPLMIAKPNKVSAKVFYWIYACDSEEGKIFGKIVANETKRKFKLVGNLNENIRSSIDDENYSKGSKTYFSLEYNHKDESEPKSFKINLMINKKNEPEYADLVTKKPDWDPETKRYTLDFKYRALEPSTSNLQIIDEFNKNNVLLQLGKVNNRCYNLDFKYPFNAFSAFGLGLSCLSND
jgi:hypothetical protein